MTDQTPEAVSTKPTETIEPPVADNPNPEIHIDSAGAPAVDGGETEDQAPRKTAGQDRAERLSARAKASREERGEGIPHTGDFNDERQTYGEHGQAPEEPAQPEPNAQAPAERKVKLRVRQEDREYTEAERDALAQKAAAGDSYLEESRQTLEEARLTREEARQIRENARRSQGAPHQGQERTQDHQPSEPRSGQPRQDDPLATALEELQLGADPKETAAKVRNVIASETRATSQNEAQAALHRQRMSDDYTETVNAFVRIRKENEPLFSDKYAEAVMERMMYDELADDLRAINVPEDRIPKNPRELQNWHRHYRTEGLRVRKPEALFNDVIGKFRAFRGQPGTSTPGQQPPAARPNPSLNARTPVVAVDRDERRASIPTQPARSAAPPRLPASIAAPKKTRLEIIAEQRELRKGRPFRRAG